MFLRVVTPCRSLPPQADESLPMTPPDTQQILVDEETAASRLDMSERNLRALRDAGTGPRFARVGRLVRYRPADLAEWAASRIVEGKEARP